MPCCIVHILETIKINVNQGAVNTGSVCDIDLVLKLGLKVATVIELSQMIVRCLPAQFLFKHFLIGNIAESNNGTFLFAIQLERVDGAFNGYSLTGMMLEPGLPAT